MFVQWLTAPESGIQLVPSYCEFRTVKYFLVLRKAKSRANKKSESGKRVNHTPVHKTQEKEGLVLLSSQVQLLLFYYCSVSVKRFFLSLSLHLLFTFTLLLLLLLYFIFTPTLTTKVTVNCVSLLTLIALNYESTTQSHTHNNNSGESMSG